MEELATHGSLSFEEMQLLKSKPARNHLPQPLGIPTQPCVCVGW